MSLLLHFASTMSTHAAGPCATSGGFYSDATVFQTHLAQLGIAPIASWNFAPHDLPLGSSVTLNDPLNINTHALNGNDPWTNGATNTWPGALNNIQFSSNTTPSGPLTPRGANGLTFANPSGNNMLSATVAADSLSIVCESPTNTRCQAMGLVLRGPTSVSIRVYNFEGPFETFVNVASGQQAFVGFIKTRITRVDIWNASGSENLASLAVYRKPYPLDVVGNDGVVNVGDLLAVISAWGSCIGCPADVAPPGGNNLVNVADLLAIISAWGTLPPLNTQCVGDNPSIGACQFDSACFPLACDPSTCTPSACICDDVGQWHCTNDCCGHCI